MGHLTLTGADLAGVQASARAAAVLLGLPGLPDLPGQEGL
jgi:5-(carboxyamino)imidazole ribonucleotide synthase